MKTINDYTIYCTTAQTKRALELGASIDYAKVIDVISGNSIRIPEETGEFYLIPTTDQIIGWLEEQNIHINIAWSWNRRITVTVWYHPEKEHICTAYANSRKDAILNAIDAALNYLTNKMIRNNND